MSLPLPVPVSNCDRYTPSRSRLSSTLTPWKSRSGWKCSVIRVRRSRDGPGDRSRTYACRPACSRQLISLVSYQLMLMVVAVVIGGCAAWLLARPAAPPALGRSSS